jgi:hypothetical protein
MKENTVEKNMVIANYYSYKLIYVVLFCNIVAISIVCIHYVPYPLTLFLRCKASPSAAFSCGVKFWAKRL